MGIERQDSGRPNPFGFPIESIIEESRSSPDKSPYFFLARYFGSEGQGKFKRVSEILTKEGLGDEPLGLRTSPFLYLDADEREEFRQGMGAVGLHAVLVPLFIAKNTFVFDYKLLASIYNARTTGTSVLPIEEAPVEKRRVDPVELTRLFHRNPSGEFIFSPNGIDVVPMLETYLKKTELLDIIRTRTLVTWEKYAAALTIELRNEGLSIAEVLKLTKDMPLIGDRRDGRTLSAEQHKQSEDLWRRLLSEDEEPRGPNN
jgi:hypothetical protein